MELTREQIGNACHAWLQKAMEASKSVRVLDPEEVIEAVTPHVQYAAIPETGALTEEQWNQLRTEFGTGESTVHRWLCRSDIERVLSSRPSPTPAPKSAAPTDVSIHAPRVGGYVQRMLRRGTSGEKWSLYRAIASLAHAELESQLAEARKLSQWVRIDEEHLPKEGDEVGYWSVTGLGELWLVRTVAVNWNLSQCRSARWTHYRPNNAPTGKESHD